MKSFIISIAGGSGSGKTTLALALKRSLGRKASVFSLDNYQRFGRKLSVIDGIKNWDHPSAVNWEKFVADLKALKNGKAITTTHRDQANLKFPRKIVFKPNQIIITEGYLLFHPLSVRKLLDFLIFTSAKEKTRVSRRRKFKNDKYTKKVLLPMHRKYIEPTKQYADVVIDTEKLSLTECVNLVRKRLKI